MYQHLRIVSPPMKSLKPTKKKTDNDSCDEDTPLDDDPHTDEMDSTNEWCDPEEPGLV